MTQDFGDDGELYQTLLKRVVQFIMELEDADQRIAALGKDHDISGILAETKIQRTLRSILKYLPWKAQ